MKRIIKKNNSNMNITCITLSIFLGLVFSPLNSYSHAESVSNGVLTIDTQKITYEYDNIINPITLSPMPEETLTVILNGNKSKILNFDYISKTSQAITEDTLSKAKNGVLITNFGRAEISSYTSLTLELSQKDSVFAIIDTTLQYERSPRTILFENGGSTIINSTNMLFINNEALTEDNLLSFFYNTNTLDLKSELFTMENNSFCSRNESVSLFYNGSNLSLDAIFTNINRNIIVSEHENAVLFYNENGLAIFGTAYTEKLIISYNDVGSEVYHPAFLFINSHILNLNSRFMTITKNSVTPTLKLKDSNGVERLYSVIFYNGGALETIMNINLYGINPYFTLYDNGVLIFDNPPVGYNFGVIGIALINNSQLNFINNSDTGATIKLRHDVISLYRDDSDNYHANNQNINSIITLKNGEYEKDGKKFTYSGPIRLDLGSSIMMANTFNIEAKTIFILTADDKKAIGGLVGVGGNDTDANTLPKLNITNKLIISADLKKNSKNIEIKKPYTIISGFVITEDVKNRIILNGNLDAVIDYADDANNKAIKIVTITFNSLAIKVEEEIRNNYNYNTIYDMFTEDYDDKNETLERIAWFLEDTDANNTVDDKISLIKDILPTEPSDVVAIASSLILKPINDAIISRLTTINGIKIMTNGSNSDNSPIASDDKNTNGTKKSTFELWFDAGYNFSYNYGSNSSISSKSIVIGGEYGYGTKDNLLGLVYSYTSGNSNNYVAKSLALYSNINFDRKGANFMTIIINFGYLETKEVRNSNKDNITIVYNYGTEILSSTGIFGHNIKLAKDDILTPKIMVRYSYMSRNAPSDDKLTNIDLNINELSIGILTPAIGLDYQRFINKSKTLVLKASVNFKYDINLTDEINTNLSFTDDYYRRIYNTTKRILKYDANGINNFGTELFLAINYYNPAKPDLKFFINGHIGIDTNKHSNMSISVGGEWKVR